MRPVGIILVFMNLLFSIATCALIVVVYSTRANWKKEYDSAKNLALVAEAAYKSEKQSHENDLRGREERITTLANQITNINNDIATAKAAKDQSVAQYEALKASGSGSSTTLANLNAQVGQLSKELESLKAERSNREGRIIALEKEKNDERTQRVDFQVKLASLQSRNEKLAQDFSELNSKYQIMSREYQRMGVGSRNPGSLLSPDVKPAPSGVNGEVKYVNGNQAQISVGTDSGVTEGNILQVFRLNPDPKLSVYLGTLRISRSEPKSAIGIFEASPASRIKSPTVGDTVSTSLNK